MANRENGGNMSGLLADRTAELERQVAKLEAELLQAQKLTSLGELMGTTTHEFNNILMTVLNYARMGMRHKDEPTRDKAFEKINAAAQRAAKITGSVLGVARNRATSFAPTDLAKLLDETLILLDRELNKYRIAVELQIGEAPPAWAVGNQIQQIILNLIINARQAMLNGGQLILRVEHDKTHQTVDLTVRDSGSGIPADKLRHIFEPFFTTKTGPDESGQGGTGLGLSACKRIVEAHRGRIRVESTVGKGTAITIKLPVAPAIAPPATEPAPAIAAAIQPASSTPAAR
ncbi:Wide host range VirA protein [Anatilimnocola aggregata]|uniref:histidine kinase n=1 Tax=Anatilimnocola aggregata TaxID=2528021 RepID=A0A517YHU9_9BACT|nr:ATP-binding protein [Anatilimnocola aggregata]QDU29798.1 Wide host range VirA protein [Anatilimnocola aggregata]